MGRKTLWRTMKNVKRPKRNISRWNNRNSKRISDPTKILKVAQSYIQTIYTNSGNPAYQYQPEIISLSTTFKKVKDLISKLNLKKVPEADLIIGTLLQLPDKATRKLIVINWSTMKNKEDFTENRQQHKDFDSRNLSETDTRIKRLVETIRNPHLRKNVALAISECPILN
ncbi:hypothetical protein HZH68_007688 [Vespula germanica]|uniref:Uncharacterized protein n=1 Tax=Vespula germanica TaxID=30212 RepID=A0A834K312_VESGE|nr:hypothetical protein HZH68_007688 [Vespula germanica]